MEHRDWFERWGPKQGWKRTNYMSFVAAPLLAFLLLGLVGLGSCEVPAVEHAIDGMRRLDKVGPRTLVGTLAGPQRTTPTGSNAVLWAAWLDVDTPGDDDGMESECDVLSLSGASIEVGDERFELDLLSGDNEVRVAGRHRLTAAPGEVGLRMAEIVANAPAMRGYPECQNHNEGPSEYGEASASSGAMVVVSGCRNGDKISACEDGLDFVVSACRKGETTVPCDDVAAGISTMRVGYAAGAMNGAHGLAGFGGLVFFIIGGVAGFAQRRLAKIQSGARRPLRGQQ